MEDNNDGGGDRVINNQKLLVLFCFPAFKPKKIIKYFLMSLSFVCF
jgi:hypothetical protein